MAPTTTLPEIGPAKVSADKDNHRQSAIILEGSEQYPSLSKAISADTTLRTVLLIIILSLCGLIAVLALLAALLLRLLVRLAVSQDPTAVWASTNLRT